MLKGPEIAPTEPSAAATSSRVHPRPLACVLCQQRKVKCDRRNPCSNCVRSSSQCVQASLTPRKRRFPERALLERLRRYEDLLRQNNIDFDPLHRGGSSTQQSPGSNDKASTSPGDSGKNVAEDGTVIKADPEDEKNFWHFMDQMTLQDDDEADTPGTVREGVANEATLRAAMEEMYENHFLPNHLFFAIPAGVNLAVLHPKNAQVFKLWQVYLQNVDPMLKITHTPTLQPRIVDAAADLESANPALHALMFGIYAVAIMTLDEDESIAILGLTPKEAMNQYQLACQHALLTAGFLRSTDLDCLTALLLYLLAARRDAEPRTISAMLSMALKIAQRMDLPHEASNAKHNCVEAELRRRIWWGLVMFDNRLCEMSHYRSTSMTPLWDCKLPSNINDFDLRAESKEAPTASQIPTEAIIPVIRCEISDTIRNSNWHLDFVNPLLKQTARKPHTPLIDHNDGADGLISLGTYIETTYLSNCSPTTPLHFMALCLARGQIAKNRLLEHYSRHWWSQSQQTDADRNASITFARTMLDSDTRAMLSPLSRGFRWLSEFYVPVPAYFHIFQELKYRPLLAEALDLWGAVGDNYFAHALGKSIYGMENPFFRILCRMALGAWEARENLIRRQGHFILDSEVPGMIADMREKIDEFQKGSGLNFLRGQGVEGGSGVGAGKEVGMEDLGNVQFGMPEWAVNFDTGANGGMGFDMSGVGNEGVMMDPSSFDWTGMTGWNSMPLSGGGSWFNT